MWEEAPESSTKNQSAWKIPILSASWYCIKAPLLSKVYWIHQVCNFLVWNVRVLQPVSKLDTATSECNNASPCSVKRRDLFLANIISQPGVSLSHALKKPTQVTRATSILLQSFKPYCTPGLWILCNGFIEKKGCRVTWDIPVTT